MGILGTISDTNLLKSRVETGLLSLLFISVYQFIGLIYQGFLLQSILFFLAGTCQLYYLITPRKHHFCQKIAVCCILLPWLALLNLSYFSHEWGENWLLLLTVCSYLLLNVRSANLVNGILLVTLALVLSFQYNLSYSAAQLLPFIILIVILNVLIKQFTYLQASLKHSQSTDLLTGCANRDYFMHEVAKASGISRRYKISVSMIVLRLNSCHDDNLTPEAAIGLQENDQYLHALAQLWTSRLRNTDILCRYSDTVFTVLLPSTSQDSATILAKDLIKANEGYEFNGHHSLSIHVNIVAHNGQEGDLEWLNRAFSKQN